MEDNTQEMWHMFKSGHDVLFLVSWLYSHRGKTFSSEMSILASSGIITFLWN